LSGFGGLIQRASKGYCALLNGIYCLVVRAPLLLEKLTRSVIGAFYEVYNTLGYGFLENLYVAALEQELSARGHRVSRQFDVLVRYKGQEIGHQRLDLVVDECLVLEIKSTERLHPYAGRQLYNYLKATNLEVGLLLHFSPSGAKVFREVCSNIRG
jgi:GxxExxY protein